MMSKIILLLCIVMVGCEMVVNSTNGNRNSQIVSSPLETPTPQVSDTKNVSAAPRYLGCWTGMGGGKIKITTEKLFDLGSREESKYQEVSHKEMNEKEEFVLKANSHFSKSFLSRIIKFTVGRDNLAAVVTYDSDKDFSGDRLSGQGLFEKIECEKLK